MFPGVLIIVSTPVGAAVALTQSMMGNIQTYGGFESVGPSFSLFFCRTKMKIKAFFFFFFTKLKQSFQIGSL